MSLDKLIYMANQIGRFFSHQSEEKAVASIADHIAKFWDPRMRAEIFAHLEKGRAGLDPLALKAVESLAKVARQSLKQQEPAPRP